MAKPSSTAYNSEKLALIRKIKMPNLRSASERRSRSSLRDKSNGCEITVVCIGMDDEEVEVSVSLCSASAKALKLSSIHELNVHEIETDSFVCICEPKGSGWLKRMVKENGKTVARKSFVCDYDQVYTKTGFPKLIPVFSVSIIVTVYNRPDVAIPCINSILDRTEYPFKRLVVMDDASDDYTFHRLKSIDDKRIEIVSAEKNRGYLAQVNDGLNECFADSDYCVVVNSDVLVTDGWLTAMVRAAYTQEADLVNPLCNNAGGQCISFPGESSPSSVSMDGANSYLGAASALSIRPPQYIRAAPSIGQCLLISDEAWTDHGPFDEEVYGTGYGEECEFWANAVREKKKAIIATDCFVYHESHATHGATSGVREREGFNLFLDRNRETYYSEVKKAGNFKYASAPIVKAINSSRPHGIPVSFVCNDIGPWGGVMAMLKICQGLNEVGFDSSVNYSRTSTASRTQGKISMPFGPNRVRGMRGYGEWKENGGFDEGIVFATHFHSVRYLEEIQKISAATPAAFWQDREDFFRCPEGKLSVAKEFVERYSAIPNRIANAHWVSESAKKDLGVDKFSTIPVGVDTDLFYPSYRRQPNDVVRIVAMWRPQTPRRGHKRLTELYKRLRAEFGSMVSLEVYGQDLEIDLLDGCLDRHHGWLSQRQAADLVRQMDIVIEPSDFQGFGLPGLEAMASGCLLISTDNQGIHEYGQDGLNCVITNDIGFMVDRVSQVVESPWSHEFMKRNARKTSLDFDWSIIFCRWADEILSWDANWPFGFEKEAREIRKKCEIIRERWEGKI